MTKNITHLIQIQTRPPEELLKPMFDVSDAPQKENIKDAEIIPEKQNDLFGGEKI